MRSKNHDLVKSVEESTSPVDSAKEDAKNAADNEWGCSLTKIRESMGISGKSVDENIPPIGTHEEHVKKEADSEWECSLAKIKETMRISGESVDEDIPPIGTPKEHAKTALDSDQEFSLSGSKESTTGVSEECSDQTGLNRDSNDSQSHTVEQKDGSTESSNGSGVPVVMPVYPVGTLNAMGGNIEQDEKFSRLF